MDETRIRVLIADDHTIVRKGLRALLSTKDDIAVVGEAGDGLAAVEQALALQPDIILMDISMPGIDGVEATRRILAHDPRARILVLTSFSTDDKVFPALTAGAQGYLLKDSEPEELVSAIRRIHHGESSLHPAVASRVLQRLTHPAEHASAHGGLTERELEVTRLIARGLKNRAVAEQLIVSETTIRAHVSNILAKLHLATRTELALYALREGLATLDSPCHVAE
jgi:two-component system, NarL family, response regulator LiaR